MNRCLNSLLNQEINPDIIELIVVDNKSDNGFQSKIKFDFPFQFKLIHENRLGLTHARIAGINVAIGDMIVFVDDDNFLHSSYLKNIITISERYAEVGCFGAARIFPEFEVEPSTELLPHLGLLALRDDEIGGTSSDVTDYLYPYGAGLVLRRDVALSYINDVCSSDLKLSLDRQGSLLNSCGDDHFSWIAIRLGYKKGVFPELQLTHYIPEFRVQKDYLLRLMESFGYSRSLLFYINGMDFPGLNVIQESSRLSKRVPKLRMFFYRIKSGFLKMFSRDMGSIEEEFKQARNAGVLRFYNQVYLKYNLSSN